MSLLNLFKYIDGSIKIKGSKNFLNPDFVIKNRICLKIKGNNNKIITGNCSGSRLSIQIFGDNNTIYLEDNVEVGGIIEIGFQWHNKVNNSVIRIGKGTTINTFSLIMLEPDSKVIIGEDCLFATEIDIWASDTHSITDNEGKLLNYGGNIEIGNHVWVGKGVKIGKNVKIADNSIVGFGSVVTSQFTQKNIVIAGNPAIKVKDNINWNKLSPFNYKQNNQK